MPRYTVAATDKQGKGVVRHYTADTEQGAMGMARLELLTPHGAELELDQPSPGTPLYAQNHNHQQLGAPIAVTTRRAGGMEHAPISTIAAGILLSSIVYAPLLLCFSFAHEGGPLGIGAENIRLIGLVLTLILIGLVFTRAIRGK